MATTGLSAIKGLAATLTSHGLALRADGTVATWGFNINGARGDGSTTDRHSPVSVSGFNRGSTPGPR